MHIRYKYIDSCFLGGQYILFIQIHILCLNFDKKNSHIYWDELLLRFYGLAEVQRSKVPV